MFDDGPGTPLDALITELRRLPGVGAKSAQRYANHLLRVPQDEALGLAKAIRTAVETVQLCSICHDLGDEDPCPICRNPERSEETVCVVEDPWTVRRIERTRAYRGRYHVLHGSLSAVRGVGPDELRLSSLEARAGSGKVKEVILATSPTSDGEATAALVAERLRPHGIRVSRIAYGIPVGSDLETIDEVTLTRALDGRTLL